MFYTGKQNCAKKFPYVSDGFKNWSFKKHFQELKIREPLNIKAFSIKVWDYLWCIYTSDDFGIELCENACHSCLKFTVTDKLKLIRIIQLPVSASRWQHHTQLFYATFI